MKHFDYVKVSGLTEAVDLLIKRGERAHLLAGGTDVLVKMKQKQMTPELLVDITLGRRRGGRY
jgi:CO/xanthine dehydrogenase FAD-binding subunit